MPALAMEGQALLLLPLPAPLERESQEPELLHGKEDVRWWIILGLYDLLIVNR